MKMYKEELYPYYEKVTRGEEDCAFDIEVPDEIAQPYLEAKEKLEKELAKVNEYVYGLED